MTAIYIPRMIFTKLPNNKLASKQLGLIGVREQLFLIQAV